MKSLFARVSIFVLSAFTLTSLAHASTVWPGLRGPSYDGAVHDAQLFEDEGGNLSIGWIRELGSGYSVVSVDGRRLIAAFQAGSEDVVAAFDLEHGDELWRQALGEAYDGHSGSHDGPVATPVLSEGRVFALGPRGDLMALDAGNGKTIWELDLVADLEAEIPFYGFSTSPVIAEDVLVVQIGAGEGKTFGGFATATGELLWSTGTDSIDHQSPIVIVSEGRQQVIGVGQKTVTALDPATGEAIWSYEHNGDGAAMGGETIVPVPAGEGRLFLMNNHPTSVMLQIEKGDPYQISVLWEGGSIKSSYVIPVYHDGYLYGMNSKIFTCVDAATGEIVWRSREAGDGFPTLVGDHLVIMNKPGTLRVAKASPEGYQQVTSIELFEDHSWSAPAYANGHLFVRSMNQLARIDINPAAGTEAGEETSWVASTGFGRFLAGVESASDKTAAIDAYLARQDTFPIIEDSGAVHFVYRADEATDVGIVGDMIGFRREDPMTQMAGTDLFHYSTRLEPTAAVTYGFIVDYSEPVPDPLNDATTEGLFGDVSWFAMPAWQAPQFVGEADPVNQGRLETYEWESQIKEGQTRKATIYLPVGYDQDSARQYPSLYFFDGGDALENGRVKPILDNLLGDAVQPLVAVFIHTDPEAHGNELWEPSEYVEMVATELIPAVDEKYRTLSDPTARAATGSNNGGDAAFLGAFAHPEIFGRVGTLWPVIFGPQLTQIMPRADSQSLVIYHVWGTYHIRSPHEAWDQVVENRAFFQALREAGYRPTGGEVPEGVGWPFFNRYVGEMLTALFPML